MATEPSAPSDLDTRLRSLAPGWRFAGRYRLDAMVGRGAMGVVWRSFDETLERPVALKFLVETLVHDPMAIDDLKRETRRSLELTHHNIVRVYDFVDDQAQALACIAMEFFSGRTLAAARIAQPNRCFTPEDISPWLAQLCDALTYAHEKVRVIHRDLKPQNMMLDESGELKVTDFGIARTASDSMTRISIGKVSGTPCYMSPQQARGLAPVVTDDIYAIGATIYELLTSRPPFWQGNVPLQLEAVTPPPMTERRLELTGIDGEFPAPWEDVITACLSKDASVRPQTARDLADRLGITLPSTHFHLPVRRKPVIEPPVEEELPLDAPTIAAPVDLSSWRPSAVPEPKPIAREWRESKAWRSLPQPGSTGQPTPPQTPPAEPALPKRAPRKAAAPPPLPPPPSIPVVTPSIPPPTPVPLPITHAPATPRRGIPLAAWLAIAAVILAVLAFGIGAVARHFLAQRGVNTPSVVDFVPGLRGPRTIQVPGEYPTIQAAIDAGREGDTILVQPGTYAESLTLRDGLRLQGTSADDCRLTAVPGAASAIFIPGGRNIVVENLTVEGNGAAEASTYTAGWTLTNSETGVIISALDPQGPAARAGIPVGARLKHIDGVPITSAEVVPYLLAGQAKARDCSITFERTPGSPATAGLRTELLAIKDSTWPEGIVVADAEAKITGCTVRNVGCVGILVVGPLSTAEIRGNQVTGNGIHGVSLLRTTSAVVVSENQMRGNKGAGLRIEDSDAVVTSNQMEGNGSVGITITGASATPTLRNNQSSNNTNSGLHLAAGAGGTIEENVFEKNGDSGIIALDAGTSPTLRGNRCRSNLKNGIFFTDGARGLVEANVVEGNGFPGICAQGKGTSPTLRRNECHKNEQSGILFTKAATGTLEENQCDGNGIDGIAIGEEGTAVTLTGNFARQNRANGISVSKQATARLENNVCSGNTGNGIAFASAARGGVSGNRCDNNSDSGLAAFGEGTVPVFSKNTANGNAHYGLYFGNGADGEASANLCEGNRFSGIGIANTSTRPLVTGNRLTGNQKFGIESFSGASPRISQDNIFANNGSGNISR